MPEQAPFLSDAHIGTTAGYYFVISTVIESTIERSYGRAGNFDILVA
jgi:hypothetical protein